MRLPDELVHKLNDAGFGGRLVYVPLKTKARTASEVILEDMLEKARQGKHIDIDEYKNTVSMRTLYRLKQKAVAQAKGGNGNGNGNEK